MTRRTVNPNEAARANVKTEMLLPLFDDKVLAFEGAGEGGGDKSREIRLEG